MNGSGGLLGPILLGIGLLGSFFIWLWHVASDQAILKLKVETLWAFLFRRGVIEGFQKGWLVENSPVELTQKAIKAMEPITPIIKTWYDREGFALSDLELLLQLEYRFGDQILTEVCKPNLITNGVCLIAAALVCGRKLTSTAPVNELIERHVIYRGKQ